MQRINAHDLHLRHTAQMRAEYIDELVQRRKKAAVPPAVLAAGSAAVGAIGLVALALLKKR